MADDHLGTYKTILEMAESYVPNEQEVSEVVERISRGRIIGVGAGRTGYALQQLIYHLAKTGSDAYFVDDTNCPKYLVPHDTIFAASGSGNSEFTLCSTGLTEGQITKIMAEYDPDFKIPVASPVYSITTKPDPKDSKLARISKATGGKIIEIKAKNKEQVGLSAPVGAYVPSLGSQFEWWLNNFGWSVVSKKITGRRIDDCQKDLFDLVEARDPTYEDIENSVNILSETLSDNKILAIYNQEIEKPTISFVDSRLRHMGLTVIPYKDDTRTQEGDVILSISAIDGLSEKPEIAARFTKKEKNASGAKVLAICYDNSRLRDVVNVGDGDYVITLPVPEINISDVPERYISCLKDAAFAEKVILISEAIIHGLERKLGVSEKDEEEYHSRLF